MKRVHQYVMHQNKGLSLPLQLVNTGVFFCDQSGDLGELHQASTFGLDSRVRTAALKVGDTNLLAKSSAGDGLQLK